LDSVRRSLAAFFFAFSVFLAGPCLFLTPVYVAAYLLSAQQGETFVRFMEANDFPSFYLAFFFIGVFVGFVWGAVTFWSNTSSARHAGRTKRLIDAWLTKLSRGGEL
jgi:hypothetical protein